MTSIIHPGLAERIALLRDLRDPSVRRAFDRASKDLQIDSIEVADIFRAASRDNPFVPGDSTTRTEKADLMRIRKGGQSLLTTLAAEQNYDARLDALAARPELRLSDDDGGLRSSLVAIDRVAIKGQATGFVHCPPNAFCIQTLSTFEVELDEKSYRVHPRHGESAASVASRLAAELEQAGYGAKVEKHRGQAILSITRPEGARSLEPGAYHQLSGEIVHRQIFGIGGEAPPSGTYLVLDEPRKVNGQLVKELYVERWPELEEGAKLQLNGRLDIRSFGGVEMPPTNYYALSGVTNLSAGEPKFDGETFTNAEGKTLPWLSYNRPLMYDAPAKIFVLDQGHDTAFVGAMGGMVPPWKNGFHGLSGSAEIESATAADRNAITIGADGVPTSKATQQELTHVGLEPGPSATPIPGGAQRNWYFDAEGSTLYRIDSRASAPNPHQLSQVVRLSTES